MAFDAGGVLDTTVSRVGQVNGAGDPLALFLEVFSGEVLAQFEKTQQFKERHYIRSIASGKSAQFPVIGRAQAQYQTPGQYLDGQEINQNAMVISIDQLLVSTVFIADIDEAMNHYDIRSKYSAELGRILAQKFDINVACNFIKAARASAAVADGVGGSVMTNSAMATDVNVLTSALFASAQAMDEKFIPPTERYAFVRPAQFYALAQNTTLINKFLGGEGSIAKGEIETVAGFPIVKTNNLPSTDLTTDTTVSPSAQANFTNTVACVSHKDAVGTVKLRDMSMESDREIRRQGWFFIAKYLCGHGILRPECAIELATATAPTT